MPVLSRKIFYIKNENKDSLKGETIERKKDMWSKLKLPHHTRGLQTSPQEVGSEKAEMQPKILTRQKYILKIETRKWIRFIQ